MRLFVPACFGSVSAAGVRQLLANQAQHLFQMEWLDDATRDIHLECMQHLWDVGASGHKHHRPRVAQLPELFVQLEAVGVG